jgi:hypothetical protein
MEVAMFHSLHARFIVSAALPVPLSVPGPAPAGPS